MADEDKDRSAEWDLPGATPAEPEPKWPLYERRAEKHYAESVKRGDCACPWLLVVLEDLALYGLPARRLAVCEDCGRVWASGA